MARAIGLAAVVAVALATLPARAQEGALRIHQSSTPTAPSDTTVMRRLPIAGEPSRTAWVGAVVLALPPSALLTVGLEDEGDGTATLSFWLSDEATDAFADLTRRSVGQALAVVYEGRVLATPVVEAEIRNGHVVVSGLTLADGERVAAGLRAAMGGMSLPSTPARPPVEPPRGPDIRRVPIGGEAAPPPRVDPAGVAMPEADVAPPRPTDTAGPSAEAAAQAFVSAIARRDWRAAVDALHPDALARLRLEATGVLRIDGRTVRVQDGRASGTLRPEDVLGRPLRGERLAALSDGDLAMLYLAGLDVLGVWGPPGLRREAIGTVADGADLIHVLLRPSRAVEDGVSEVSIVTLRRDAAGRWRPLLTHAQGF